MRKNAVKYIVSAVVLVLAVALAITGVVGMNTRGGEKGAGYLKDMRTRAVLLATGEGAVESYVAIAKAKAMEEAKAAGGGMSAIREAVAKAEEEARANSSANMIDFETADMTGIDAALTDLKVALDAYYAEEASAQAAYIAEMEAAGNVVEEEVIEAEVDAAGEADLDSAMLEEEEVVDMSGFVATPEMERLMGVADEKYVAVGAELTKLYEALDEDALNTLKSTIYGIVAQSGDDFAARFDRYAAGGGLDAVNGRTSAQIARYGDDLIYISVALVFLALIIAFYRQIVKALGVPRMIIGMFFIVLCVVALLCDLSLTGLMSSTLVRMGMNSILVLAMVPGIQSGIGLNLGLPIGIVGGLIGGLMAIEYRISGWVGFLFACAVGIVISLICGWLYGNMLNRLKGSEMSVTTYVGFSIVSLMCIAWLVLPFKSLELRWPLGTGLRNTISMNSTFSHLLDDFLAFKIGSLKVPTGLLLFMILCCFLMWLFMRSKTGVAMRAVGNNQRFAEATGTSVNKMRIIGTMLSTMLGAIGILVYSQSYGFMQLYTAPRQMGFVAASAILIGGASTSRCKISHVLIGTFLFQGVLTLGMPVANALVPQSTISETMRILISNGIILYALTKSGGESRA